MQKEEEKKKNSRKCVTLIPAFNSIWSYFADNRGAHIFEVRTTEVLLYICIYCGVWLSHFEYCSHWIQ